MDAFVINLDHRPDRFRAFENQVGRHLTWARIQRFSAILGKDLVIDGTFMERIVPKYRTPQLADWMRANFGCTLSHVACWRRIAESNKPGLVFEDDARLFTTASAMHLQSLLQRVPRDVGLVFLNDYNRPDWRADLRLRAVAAAQRIGANEIARGLDSAIVRAEAWLAAELGSTTLRAWDPMRLKSTEAYFVRPEFARKAAEYVERNLGAVDIQIQAFFAAEPTASGCELTPPMFFQADRRDSDIRNEP